LHTRVCVLVLELRAPTCRRYRLAQELGRSFMQYRLHAFVQLYTMVFIPLCMQMVVSALTITEMHPLLLRGMMIVGCMPPPVSSATILTRAAGGNEAAAIFNSAFGSFLGIFVTPILLLNSCRLASLPMYPPSTLSLAWAARWCCHYLRDSSCGDTYGSASRSSTFPLAR